MGHPSLCLPARIALAGLIAACLVPATAMRGDAATSPVSLAVHVGYEGVFKIQEWMPVSIDVKNAGGDLEGSIQVESVFTSQPGLPNLALYQFPLSLGAGASKHLRTYATVNPAAGLNLTVRILQNGHVVASQQASSGSNTGTLIGVLSDDPTALDEFAALHPAGLQARVVHLHAADIAESAIVLRAFDLLAIDDFATDTLTSGQRSAISVFVRNGGSLLIGTGASWRKTLGGVPAGILPMSITGTSTVAASHALSASGVEVATGSLSGQPWLAEGSQALLIDRHVGSGLVTLATFDWNQQPIAGSSAVKTLLRQVMVRGLLGPNSQQNSAIGIGGPGPFGGSGTSISERSNALESVLGNLPALDLPSLPLTGALVLLYVLLVGPINYVVLGAMRRRELSWITIPVIAVLVAGGAYGIGIGTKGRSVQSNQVAIVHLSPGSDLAYQETYTGILTPTRGDYQVSVPGDRLFISPLSANGNFGSSSGLTRIDPESNAVTLEGITAFTLRGFASEGFAKAPALTGHLQLVNGNLTGQVENRSSMAFTDALVIAGDSYQKLGALAPGASVAINLTAKAGNPFGGSPVYTRIYSSFTFGPPPNAPTAADREGQARTQILSLLQPGLGFKGPTSAAIQPMIVAWSRQPFQTITVNGNHPRPTAETAVALSLPIDAIGAGTVPAGAVSARLIDVVGDTRPAGPPGLLLLQNGSVTYEFAPPLAAATRLTAASITVSNPFGGKFVGPPGSNGTPQTTTKAEVWNWPSSTWTEVAYQENGTTAVPDSAVNPTTGQVRLRLSGNNASFMTGGVSLTGTVQ